MEECPEHLQIAVATGGFTEGEYGFGTRHLRQNTIKFQEGVGSTLEMAQAESELKNSQINYLNAVYDLVLAKIEYHKAIGKPLN